MPQASPHRRIETPGPWALQAGAADIAADIAAAVAVDIAKPS
jgi:hypothetical protein